jgi:hypothetical protein
MEKENLLGHFNLTQIPFAGYIAETPADKTSPDENKYDVTELDEKETGAHIRSCLRKAGAAEQIFYASAVRKVFSYTGGDVQLVNTLCHCAMLKAIAKEKKVISEDIVRECMEELLDQGQDSFAVDEKRKHERKQTNLSGSYYHNATKERGGLTITNLSIAGMQIKLNKQRQVRVGDRVIISFKLEDEKKTSIREMMVIRNVFGFFAGAAFNSQPNTDAFEAYIKSK